MMLENLHYITLKIKIGNLRYDVTELRKTGDFKNKMCQSSLTNVILCLAFNPQITTHLPW